MPTGSHLYVAVGRVRPKSSPSVADDRFPSPIEVMLMGALFPTNALPNR